MCITFNGVIPSCLNFSCNVTALLIPMEANMTFKIEKECLDKMICIKVTDSIRLLKLVSNDRYVLHWTVTKLSDIIL